MHDLHKKFLIEAIKMADESVAQGGFPAGAIVVKDGEIIGTGISIGNKLNDPTSHGEMASIRNACDRLKSSDLSGAILYASMHPCLMCFSAAMWASIGTVFYAIKKENVSPEYYGGHYHMPTINQELLHPIKLVHVQELEQEAMKAVHKWERTL